MTFPTREQLDYLETSLTENVYLKACPGSGKTEIVAAMVSQAVKNWCRFPSGIAVLTFSNSATDELSKRLFKHMGESLPYPHSVSTFDSFVLNKIVADVASVITEFPGKNGDYRIRVVDKTSNLFLTTNRISGKRISACRYDFDLKSKRFVFNTGASTLDAQLNNVEQSHAIREDLQNTKRRLRKAGFATYIDIELIAIKALENKDLYNYFERLAKRYPIIFIDECQDLSLTQLRIIKNLHQFGIRFHFVGDLNQSIYGFRNAEPIEVKKLIEKLSFTQRALTENWRSGQEIVNLCCRLLKIDQLIGNAAIPAIQPKLIQYKNCPSEIAPKVFELTKNYKDVVVVARGHSTLQRFNQGSVLSSSEELAFACIQFQSSDLDCVRNAMETFASWLTMKIDMHVTRSSMSCPQEVERDLTWRLFISKSLAYLISKGLADLDMTWKQWASLIKHAIRTIPDQPFVPEELVGSFSMLRKINISAPPGLGDSSLRLRLTKQLSQSCPVVRLATIHNVKGETHDATVLVSSMKSGSNHSHWKDWLADPASEAGRFAYVASSRPRHLLVWAVKELKNDEVQTLSDLGFEII